MERMGHMDKLKEGAVNVIAWIGRLLLGAFLLIAGLVLGVMLLLYSWDFSWTVREYNYYKDPTQFVELTAEVDYIHWDTNRLTIGMTDIPEGFSERTFKIEGEAYDAVLESGLKEQLTLGQRITFMSAPRYFGNGYVMPIVEISVDGVEYLSFEDGYPYLLNEYNFFS